METDKRLAVLLGLAVALVLVGGGVAGYVQTDGGDVTVERVTFETDGDRTIDGYLYVPQEATPDDPAPGVLGIHGYINSKETQSSFAIELARRGHVVLAMDQTGHGYSDPPAHAEGWGGPAGLDYLSDRPEVDPDNVGLEGHSMGGWAVVAAADAHPDDYESMALVGSATGTAGAPEGDAEFPRNLAVVFAEYDEFHWLMWETATAPATGESEKLRTVFGTHDPVREGDRYGSLADGTARELHQPTTTHPGEHHSRTTVAATVDWFTESLDGNVDLDGDDQIWYWKEIGTAIALFGGLLGIVAVGGSLTRRESFAAAVRERPEAPAIADRGWGIAVALAAVLPVLTYYPAMLLGEMTVPVTPVTSQEITNGVVTWALLNAVITLALVGIWHRRRDETFTEARARYGLDIGEDTARTLGWSAAVAVAGVAAAYVLLLATDALFAVDFRAWVFAVKPLSTLQAGIAAAYFPAFLVFFLVLELLLHGRLRTAAVDDSPRFAYLLNVGTLIGGFVLLLVVQYAWLLVTGALPIPMLALQTIVAFQFVALLGTVGVLSTFFFRRTGRVWVGALVNAVFVTWVVVASQAIHYPF